MRLLIVTQKVDVDDAVLGFFHRWLVEFAKSFEQITAICLQKGRSELPPNVRVFSLGKEKNLNNPSRLMYVLNFYKYIWQERKNYDGVFVHMNQEYVLLGGLIWKLLGKKVFLWRNHPKGNFLTNIAVILADKVFCTSAYSYTARFKKTKIMPVGIDTNFFKESRRHRDISDAKISTKKQNSLLFFGRISPVKKVEIFIEACRLLKASLKEKGINFSADIVGDAPALDQAYDVQMRNLVKEAGLGQTVIFKPGIPNTKAPALYSQYEIYINATPTGSMDKTILEAMACGAMVVISNQALRGFIDEQFIFTENDPQSLADKLAAILGWPEAKKITESAAGVGKVKTAHDLGLLVKRVAEEFSLQH